MVGKLNLSLIKFEYLQVFGECQDGRIVIVFYFIYVVGGVIFDEIMYYGLQIIVFVVCIWDYGW